MFIRIYALIIKEILAVLRDKKSRMILIVPPLIQLLIFSFAATLDVQNVSIGILNEDTGPESFELIQRFKGSPTFKKIIYLDSPSQISKVIDTQQVAMVIHFDNQFSRNVKAQKSADVQLILDGRKSNTTQVINGYASRILEQYNADTAAKIGYTLQNTNIVQRNWYNPNLIYYWFNVPNLCGILTMLVCMLVTALSVARERELGTFDQLLVSPVRPVEILFGKTIPAVIISMAEGTIIILAAIFLFRIPLTGSLLVLYPCMFVYICSIVGFGLFISSLCSTQQQAILGTFVFMTPAVLLSGFATPIENMPEWLQTVTYVNPLRYFLVIVKGVFLKAMPFRIAFQETWPMAIIALFTLTASSRLFRRRLE